MKKTYGAIRFDAARNVWTITEAQPHVCIKLKSIFPKINKTQVPPYDFQNLTENCADLAWFIQRYPMEISGGDWARLKKGETDYVDAMNAMEAIMLPGYTPKPANLKPAFQSREYQLIARDMFLKRKRILNGDDIGLGKTLVALLAFTEPETLPAAVVVETHMPKQWQARITEFTDLKSHLVNSTRPYDLPPADIYVFKYSQLAGWVDVFATGFFKSVQFDEVQALRRHESSRYNAGKILSTNAVYCSGYSATPIYNFGDEIFNVMDVIQPGCLGERVDFLREWCGGPYGKRVLEPDALGAYLKESFMMLRRTRREVSRELPPVNKIIQSVEFDEKEVHDQEDLIRKLAMSVISGSFVERGQAARELDMRVRHMTGVSKARGVAALVRMLLESGEPVVLGGWHRDVYEIWAKELMDYAPVFYTGEETPTQKETAKNAFLEGKTDLFIISLRSGAGLDGLQYRCSTVVHGELDWSPQVHNQLTGRIDRDGQPNPVTAYFPVVDYGSDPVITDLLGLKSSQAHGIMNPNEEAPQQYSDDSRIRILAEKFIHRSTGGKTKPGTPTPELF